MGFQRKPMSPYEIRDAILSLPDEERRVIITAPDPGEYKVLTLKRGNSGNLKYDWEDIPEGGG